MFWSDKNLDIKRSWRWQAFIFFYYDDIDTENTDGPPVTKSITIPPFTISSFTKPEYGFEILETTNRMNGKETYLSKNAKWLPITITAIDADQTGPNASKAIYDYMVKSGYDARSLAGAGRDNRSVKESQASSFFTKFGEKTKNTKISLQHLNDYGVIVEQWDFLNPVIKNINFGGTLDYSTDNLMKLSLTFSYAAAEYTHGKSSKALVARTPGRLTRN